MGLQIQNVDMDGDGIRKMEAIDGKALVKGEAAGEAADCDAPDGQGLIDGCDNYAQHTDGRIHVGKVVRKEFPGHGIFTGTITIYDEGDEDFPFHVIYEDGDFEDLSWAEVNPLLLERTPIVPKGKAKSAVPTKMPSVSKKKAKRAMSPSRTPSVGNGQKAARPVRKKKS